ncbi:hypothetical protein ELQ35_07015 [Peribacillus cavernae]|uniref:Uncharacterized protein n=1 Tax=Peribacillus cavernae TaxID=1674310 RepID=A0A433HP20_9BACI|nr:hypothetical protein [Peribacillus cavernae]MDQ0217460.1 hypothetical protein [Peribacillus cavernae]RUQ30096.1 hypothetical protein ELQ35_07015 [Peribacillus cavernae]
MGYIIPITQFEYIQYANRTVNAEKQSQKLIEGLKPVVPIPFIQELGQEIAEVEKDEAIQLSKLSKTIPAFYMAQSSRSAIPEHIVAEITGKGRYFNETI